MVIHWRVGGDEVRAWVNGGRKEVADCLTLPGFFFKWDSVTGRKE